MCFQEVFQQGLASFSVDTKGFHPNEAERYEYNMYLHYSCNRDNEDIGDEDLPVVSSDTISW